MIRLCALVVLVSTVAGGCSIIDPRPAPLARNCAEWSRLGDDELLQTAEALLEPQMMARVLEVQQLPADSPDELVLEAVGSSFDKTCEIERRPGLLLTEIVTTLYR